MIKRLSRLAAGAFVVALGASTLVAQGGAGAAPPSSTNMHPRYAVLHTASGKAGVQPALSPPTWTYKYNYLGTKYKDTFVGTKPSLGAVSTTIPVDIIPVKLTYGAQVNDPTAAGAVTQTVASPLFNKSIKYIQGGTSVGKTQYEDAFQRLSLWGKGGSAAGYHTLFGTPTVKPQVSLTVPAANGGTFSYNGVTIVEANINWFDPTINSVLTSEGIPGNVLPIFVTVNSFLYDSSGCCIGGYHENNGVQTFADTNYLTTAGGFTEDVSALSHELGEWIDDPYTNNTDVPSSCASNPIYEVGDPLEGEANFGTFPYTVGGFTWHLQDLVTPVYFGAPSTTSLHGWKTFQGTPLSVCQNGG